MGSVRNSNSDNGDSVVGVFQWNCHGLQTRIEEFKQHLADCGTKYDIICLQETFLKEKQNPTFSGYNMVRRDRTDRAAGGLVTLIRDSINYTEIAGPAGIECIVVKIKTPSNCFTVANVYLAPKLKVDKTNLKDLFQPKTVIVGDLNSKSKLWGSDHSDSRGRIIEELLEENCFCCINDGQPTYTHFDGSRSHLDLGLVSDSLAARATWCALNNTMGSDHNPTVITLFEELFSEEMSAPRFKLQKADWTRFKDECRSRVKIADVASDDINIYGRQLTAAIINAAEASIPQSRPSSTRKRKHKPLPYWNNSIKQAIKERNRARNKMHKNKTTENCLNYRRLKGVAQHQIKSSAREHWQNYCSTLDSQTKLGSVWNMARKMNGTTSDHKISNLNNNGAILETNAEKAEHFAETFAAVSSNSNYSAAFSARKADIESNQQSLFENLPAESESESVRALNEPFSPAELRRAIREAKRNKASGEDRISYEMLQKMPNSSVKTVLAFYNKIWSDKNFPAAWRHSIVLPVLKQGKDKTNATSYRPISLTSTLCKILERLVATRLAYHLESNNILSGVQSGFRQGRSTVDQIIRLQDAINKHNNNKGYTVGVFIDFSNAFDMVWQKGLLIKMKKLGLTGNVFSFVENFLSDRTLQVRVGSELSGVKKLENGTAQGSVISPLLFLLMINDLPDCLDGVESSLFADDSCIFKSGRNLDAILKSIQSNLDRISAWCNLWGFKINTSKTTAVLFTHRIDKIESNLLINGVAIKVEKTAKFLGVIFDSKLTWNAHVAYIEEKCRKRLNLMRMVSGQSFGCNKTCLLTIYRALIRSVLDYGAIAFDSMSAANKTKLDVIQHKALRIACGAFCSTSAAALQVETGEMPLGCRRQQQQLNYAIKIKAALHHPAKSILVKDRFVLSRKFNENTKPFYSKVKDFFDSVEYDSEAPLASGTAPWHLIAPIVDKSLTLEVSKKDAPEALKALAMERIENYKSTVNIYTDASKTADGKTAAAFYVPGHQIKHFVRLTDNITIFAAELTAIKLAVHWVSSALSNSVTAVTIFSDSLSSLNAIETGKSACRPKLLQEVLEIVSNITTKITFVWIPSHIGLLGNEIVDKLANSGIDRATVDVAIPLGIGEAMQLAESFVYKQWQNSWTNGSTGRQYYKIEPKVTGGVKYVNKRRGKEVKITRLRLGKCCLNAYLHEIKKHNDGLCVKCNKLETVEHFLLECQNSVSTAVRQACSERKIVPSVHVVLSDDRLIEIVYSNIDRKI